ncbi:hypothetical protein LQ50_23975 [Halalkalibacter okhensis]|uniref:Uncharacterized protein n=2 Tax=Halalkalibacter okhensis TaxID=333138 RepID=A0A0B0ID81_9BACI|nr:hypothetical protein LQ50_23975 [Halalkalibacter okhensis]
MKRTISALVGLVFVAIAVYFFTGNSENNTATNELEADNIKELVHDYSVGNITNQSASITSHELIITDSDGSQINYDLPEDEFFLSIAPYVNETHP